MRVVVAEQAGPGFESSRYARLNRVSVDNVTNRARNTSSARRLALFAGQTEDNAHPSRR
jgi:hypothetical protein